MTGPRLVIVLLTVFLSACQIQTESVAYNSEVMQALQQREYTLKKMRTVLQFESGASVDVPESGWLRAVPYPGKAVAAAPAR